MKTLILGYGVSGRSAEKLLLREGREVVALDRNGPLKDDPDFPLTDIECVVLSPGIPETHPIVVRAKALGIEVTSEVGLGAKYLKGKAFGITGSNGKTTTVLLTAHILKSAGVRAEAFGNVGRGLCEYAGEDVAIIELSSFQLETLDASFLDVGMILNITPNHLDRYKSMQEYSAAKQRIRAAKEVIETFDVNLPFPYRSMEMPSKQSVQASYLLCKRCGVTDTAFLAGLNTFKKPPHRIEFVEEKEGVRFYNDSKSSNIHSTMHAVESFEKGVILICGGVHKGSSYKPWIEAFHGKVKQIIAYGKAAPIMEHELGKEIPVKVIGPFVDAVQMAKKIAQKNETVLLSPGCSSYDQFKNYEERGDCFKRLVKDSEHG